MLYSKMRELLIYMRQTPIFNCSSALKMQCLANEMASETPLLRAASRNFEMLAQCRHGCLEAGFVFAECNSQSAFTRLAGGSSFIESVTLVSNSFILLERYSQPLGAFAQRISHGAPSRSGQLFLLSGGTPCVRQLRLWAPWTRAGWEGVRGR